MATTVAVLGGGVGGLSAAHELAERGFVGDRLREARGAGRQGALVSDAGRATRPSTASASSRPSTGTCRTRWRESRPATGARATTWSAPTRILIARADGRERAARAGARARDAVGPARAGELRARRGDAARRARPSTSRGCSSGCSRCSRACDERRVEQWDLQSWWDYVQAEKRSEAFRRYLADGLTRTLVAARAKEMSARTGGLILVQLLADLSRAGDRADRVLDAPTSDAWIAPWVDVPARSAASTCGWARPSTGSPCATGGSRRRRSAARAGRPPTTTSPRCRWRSCARCSRPNCAPPSRA